MDEKQLVLNAKNGDKEAFTALYSIYKDRLYRYAFYRLSNPEDAEDAVSECVLSAFWEIKNLKTVTPEAENTMPQVLHTLYFVVYIHFALVLSIKAISRHKTMT